MLYKVTVVDDQGQPVRGILVSHVGPCAEGCSSGSPNPLRTNRRGMVKLGLGDEPIGHFVQCGPTDQYSWGGARGNAPGLFTQEVSVQIRVTPLAAQQPAPGTQPATPAVPPAPAPEDEAPGDQGNAPTPHPILVAHACGAPCSSKEGPCERHTKNQGYCYQHRGVPPHAEAA
ncbi:MAG: hypothetical protein KGN76_15465 [Acidobacteriota bacterium]|nr:hypothetical protein [Acidobacteriota bacterium]